MDGRRSVEGLALANRMTVFDVLKLVYEGVCAGRIEIAPPVNSSPVPGHSAAPWLHAEPEVRDRIVRGRFLDALKLVTAQRDKNPLAREWADHMVQLIEATITDEPIDGSDILDSTVELAELVNLECDPAEGFVLSRVNGAYTLDEILNQLPGSPLTNRVIVHNLLRRGLVRTRQATSVRRFRDEPIDGSVLDP
jgi:hypothetical protein